MAHLIASVLVTLFTLSIITIADAQTAPTTRPAAAATTIMPLGDSITARGDSYRRPLAARLRQAGYSVEFVGSQIDESPQGTLHHEGYSGQAVQQYASRFEKLYTEHPADIILLHGGHNNFAEQQPIPAMLAAHEKIITTARRINPRVTILVAQVIPSGKLPKYSYIPELNAELAKLVQRMQVQDSRLVIVDQATGFDVEQDTGGDKVHPSKSGAVKIADRWFEALTKVLPPPTPTAAP